MIDTLFFVFSFVAVITIVVAVHEYGHLLVGRLCGIDAEVFSVGLGRGLITFTDKRGTKWQIAPWPVGGYVMYRGDTNMASVDGEADVTLSPEERRRTFPGAPVWARMAAVFGGPMANFIFAFVVFVALAMVQGRVGDELVVSSIADGPWQAQQLREGDQITAIGGLSLPLSDDQNLSELLPDESVLVYDILRDGEAMSVFAPHPIPPMAGLILPRTAAADIDMRPGDLITSINGIPAYRFGQLQAAVEASEGTPIQLEVWRAGEVLEFVLVPRSTDVMNEDGGFTQYWRIGIQAQPLIEPQTMALSPWLAAQNAVANIWAIISGTFSGLANMITGAISTCNISGPIGIAEASATMASQGFERFVGFVALLSVAIGLMNLFPIPVLDGGHLVLLGYEAATGRQPHPMLSQILTTIGIGLILSLMVFALLNDVLCP